MYYLCQDPVEGDDLAQQVFLNAWRSIRRLRSAAAFEVWLRKIMVTTWLEAARRGKIETTDSDPDRTPGRTETTGQRMDLDAALGRLPSPVRLCVVLAYNEGMTHDEISAVTRLPPGTVKSHISRGSARLREVLSAYREGRLA